MLHEPHIEKNVIAIELGVKDCPQVDVLDS